MDHVHAFVVIGLAWFAFQSDCLALSHRRTRTVQQTANSSDKPSLRKHTVEILSGVWMRLGCLDHAAALQQLQISAQYLAWDSRGGDQVHTCRLGQAGHHSTPTSAARSRKPCSREKPFPDNDPLQARRDDASDCVETRWNNQTHNPPPLTQQAPRTLPAPPHLPATFGSSNSCRPS